MCVFSALIKTDELLEATPSCFHIARSPALSTLAVTTTTLSNHVRLFKLQMRCFNADLTKWMVFWQLFEAAVNSNADLLKVQKFYNLISMLDGAPREAVAGLALTNENYGQVITIFQKSFGGTQRIISKHKEALLQIESVSSSQNMDPFGGSSITSILTFKKAGSDRRDPIRTCFARSSLENYPLTYSSP